MSCLLGFNLASPLNSTYVTKNNTNPLAFAPRQDSPDLPGTRRNISFFGWFPRWKDDLSQKIFMQPGGHTFHLYGDMLENKGIREKRYGREEGGGNRAGKRGRGRGSFPSLL